MCKTCFSISFIFSTISLVNLIGIFALNEKSQCKNEVTVPFILIIASTIVTTLYCFYIDDINQKEEHISENTSTLTKELCNHNTVFYTSMIFVTPSIIGYILYLTICGLQ